MNEYELQQVIYNYVADNFGKSEADDPSWSIKPLAGHIAKHFNDKAACNGWSNYATWRVQLELVSDEVNNMLENDPQFFEGKSQSEVADELKDFVKELIVSHTVDNDNIGALVQSYALAFVSDVNWYELAGHAIEEAKQYKGEEL